MTASPQRSRTSVVRHNELPIPELVNPRKKKQNAGFDRFVINDLLLGAPLLHEADRGLEMLRLLGGKVGPDRLRVWITAEDRANGSKHLDSEVTETGGFVGLGIGASNRRRCWPIERFIDLERVLAAQFGMRAILIGGRIDTVPQVAALAVADGRPLGLAGQLTLRETAAILSRCRLFVGNDSGPLHLAAAVDTPCVEISCHPLGADPDHENAPERFWPVVERTDRLRAPSRRAWNALMVAFTTLHTASGRSPLRKF